MSRVSESSARGGYVEPRLDSACGERDDHVVAVAAGRHKEPPGTFDTRLAERLVVGGVAADCEDAIGLCGRHRGLVRIDYDEGRFLAAKDGRDLPAHSAIAAEYVVLFERFELRLHPSPPKQALEHLVFHNRLHGYGENVQHQAYAAQHDEQVEGAARL